MSAMREVRLLNISSSYGEQKMSIVSMVVVLMCIHVFYGCTRNVYDLWSVGWVVKNVCGPLGFHIYIYIHTYVLCVILYYIGLVVHGSIIWPQDTVAVHNSDRLLHCTLPQEDLSEYQVLWEFHPVGAGVDDGTYIYDSKR